MSADRVSEELREAVVAVMAEHDDPPGWMWSASDQMVYACECGDHYAAGAIDVIQEHDVLAAAAWHRAHVADALLPLIREQRINQSVIYGYELGRADGAAEVRERVEAWLATQVDSLGGEFQLVHVAHLRAALADTDGGAR